MYTRHTHYRRTRNRLLRGRAPRRGGSAPLTLRQQIGQVLGVEPQVFADARDLTVGDGNAVTTWGDWSVQAGTPTLDADGWNSSMPLVNVDATNNFSETTDAPNYTIDTPHLWVLTGVLNYAPATEWALKLSNTSQSVYRRWFGAVAGTSIFQTRNGDSTLESDTAGTITNNAPVHFGCVYDGEKVSVAMIDSNGSATLQENAPHGPGGTVVFDICYLVGGPGNGIVGQYGLTSLARCSSGAANLSNLQAVLNLHNQAYPVA